MRNISIILLLSFLVTSCSEILQPVNPCSPSEVEKILASITDIDHKFDDKYELASSTPKIALSPVISELQEIRREAEQLEVPECADKTKKALILYMDTVIKGFLQFMSGDTEYMFTSDVN